jgi:hypothetical protein
VPIYRETKADTFEPFEKTPFPGIEQKLEDWIEHNPNLLFPDETVVWFGRQTPSEFGKPLDLLGFDETGACVVVELKRGMTPREVIAQTLEYTAWVDSLGLDELNGVAKVYASRHGRAVEGLRDLYREAFPDSSGEDENDGEGIESNVTFNARQRMVIVAEEFSGEIEQTLRYLRTRLGVDISGVSFAVHVAGGERLVDTEIVVGRERPLDASSKSAGPAVTESHEQTKDRVTSDFVRAQVDALEEWLQSLAAGVTIRHGGGSNHGVWVGAKRAVHYYFAQKWLHFWLPNRADHDLETLRGLSDPVSVRASGQGVAFNVANEADLDLAKPLLLHRMQGE